MDALCPFTTPLLISRNFEVGRSGQHIMAGVQHIMDGYSGPQGIHDWFDRYEPADDGSDNGSSAHFGAFMDGTGYQYVKLTDTAWSNGPIHSADRSILWLDRLIREGKRINPATYSVEHQGKPGDILTVVQMAKSIQINKWCVAQSGIVPTSQTLVGHFQIDNVNRHFCPGPSFPWGRFLADLAVITRSLPKNEEYEANCWSLIYRAAGGMATAPKLQWELIYLAAQYLFKTTDPDDSECAHALLVALGGSKVYNKAQAAAPSGPLNNKEVERRLRVWLRQNKLRHGAEV